VGESTSFDGVPKITGVAEYSGDTVGAKVGGLLVPVLLAQALNVTEILIMIRSSTTSVRGIKENLEDFCDSFINI
jgi:hypothetical protein